MIVDTHAHLNHPDFHEDLEEVLLRAQKMGVEKIVNVGFNRESIEETLTLIRRYPQIYAAIGWHPTDADTFDGEAARWLMQLVQEERKVRAIGEIGLDYHWDTVAPKVQEAAFREQIRLAKRLKRPVIVHTRDADEDTVRILQEEGAAEVGGIMHCFAGSWEMAQTCLAMNFYIGLGGLVTFKNAPHPKEVAAKVPLERLVVETDCPYLAPVPYRGKRNETGYVRLVVEEIARLRGVPFEEVAAATSANAERLLRFPTHRGRNEP